MTNEEKFAIAWIALDGLLLRNFFNKDSYDSKEFDKTLEKAFEAYHRYIQTKDQTEHDFLMLLHTQNLVEADLATGDIRLRSFSPEMLTKEIANAASLEIIRKVDFNIFTAYKKVVRRLSKSDPSTAHGTEAVQDRKKKA